MNQNRNQGPIFYYLWYHAGTRFVVALAMLTMWFFADRHDRIPEEVDLLVGRLVFISIAVGVLAIPLVHFSWKTGGARVPNGDDRPLPPLPFLKPGTRRYPFWQLSWDFVNLALLTALTGGIASMFIPLFLIGLILSDIALDTDRERTVMMVIVFVAVIAATLMPHWDVTRCILLRYEGAPCEAVEGTSFTSVWRLDIPWEVGSLLAIFIPGAAFSSFVLRGSIARAARGSIATAARATIDARDVRSTIELLTEQAAAIAVITRKLEDHDERFDTIDSRLT